MFNQRNGMVLLGIRRSSAVLRNPARNKTDRGWSERRAKAGASEERVQTVRRKKTDQQWARFTLGRLKATLPHSENSRCSVASHTLHGGLLGRIKTIRSIRLLS